MRYLNIIKSFISFGIFTFFSLVLFSYDNEDPSFDRATNLEPKNLAGNFGAYIADPIMQLLGDSAFIMALMPLCWAYVYFRHNHVSHKLLRIIAAIVAMISLGILLKSGIIASFVQAKLDVFSNIIMVKTIVISIFLLSFYFCLALPINIWVEFIRSGFKLIAKTPIKLPKLTLPKFKTKNDEYEEKDILPARKRAPIMSSKAQAQEFQESKKTPEPIKINNVVKVPEVIYSMGGFTLPSTNLLKEFVINKDSLQQNNSVIKKNKEELLQVLSDFGVMGDVVGAYAGPVVTLYELEPSAGTKSSRVVGLSDDISRSMRAVSARIAVIPGRNAIGIELPNKQRETVYLRELLESSEYRDKAYDLPIILGKDIAGNVVVADLARMPHLLVAGTTGSGKSVAINTMILSLLYSLTPDQCKFIMVDPKMLELSVYDGIPHLLTNVVTEPGKAVVALKWVVKEMENRYRLMSNLAVRSIHNYNERIKAAVANGEVIQRTVHTGFDAETGKPKIEQVPLDMKILPFIVVIVDEMADLMLVAGKDIETSIQRLAQMARAAGIHIIMATQRPSVDVITGVIKANFPTRISFQVTSKIDSRTILGEQGAEQLLGKGDMLYMAGGSKINRIHGPFVADDEVEKVVSYLKSQGQPDYMADITSEDFDYSSSSGASGDSEDELFKQAVQLIQQEGKASTSFVQRCLKIGYNRAANIIEQMEKEGLISKPNHVGKREILM
jgi:S-DNA-T family DNA segregation ATPase FtsK/SpoIIIE